MFEKNLMLTNEPQCPKDVQSKDVNGKINKKNSSNLKFSMRKLKQIAVFFDEI